MFPQQPFKYVCPKCGYSKTVTPKSDVINPMDLIRTCPKCGAEMEKNELDFLDNIKKLFLIK
jgi:predicted RNA-binding Zn-ribbon protein involved in translation (DUF1610 family)